MNIFTLLENNFVKASEDELKSVTSIAIGCFDALHLGHFKLIERLDEHGALLVVHKSNLSQITPPFLKEKVASRKIFFVMLDEIKELDAYTFANNLRHSFIRLKYFVAGYDFRFGNSRQAHANELQNYSGIPCVVVDEFRLDGLSIHSSGIKNYLRNGDLDTAIKLLGRPYEIQGKQIKGQGLGSKFFVPTINIDYQDYFLPKEGVYFAKVFLDEKEFFAAVFIGKRSTDEKTAVEIHVLNSFYEFKFQQVTIRFLEFFRENKRFSNFAELKAQIDLDIKTLKERL